jgi:hypothetical protein
MRVAARSRTQSQRARWGARFLGAGLTAVVALGVAASPALAQAGPPSGAGVQPVEVPFPGGEPVCPTGSTPLRIDEPFTAGTRVASIPGDGTLTLTIHGADNQTFDFSINGSAAARQVFVKGGPNQNLYNYDTAHGFPNGVSADTGLHAPLGAGPNGSLFFGLSHIDFCFVPSPYNGSV